jgi:hypothetical protein
MSIHRRFNPWGHHRIGDAAAVTPADPNGPNLTPADQRSSEKASGIGGFLVGGLVGFLLATVLGPGKNYVRKYD